MQSKSLAFLFIIIIAIPIIALSSNHEIFFVVMSLIITVISIRYIFRLLTSESLKGNEADEEMEEELEDLIGIDVKKFGKGISVASNLLAILFLIYCAFFLETILLKAVTSFAIILQIYLILKKAGRNALPFDPDKHRPQIVLSSILNLAVVIFTVLNKLYKLK
jgi:hypothetical protein